MNNTNINNVNRYKKYGFKEYDVKTELMGTRLKLSKYYVNIYTDFPEYNLLISMDAKNLELIIDDDRVLLKRLSGDNVITNLNIDMVSDFLLKIYDEHTMEFIYRINDLYYKGIAIKETHSEKIIN